MYFQMYLRVSLSGQNDYWTNIFEFTAELCLLYAQIVRKLSRQLRALNSISNGMIPAGWQRHQVTKNGGDKKGLEVCSCIFQGSA
jgi:hypothetical protein